MFNLERMEMNVKNYRRCNNITTMIICFLIISAIGIAVSAIIMHVVHNKEKEVVHEVKKHGW